MALGFTLRQLEYFVAVGDAGSIAQAAEQIHISAPSISAAISGLERQFDVQLFVRQHAQGLSLTPGGRQLLAEARRLLKQADALTAVASDIGGAVRGPLAIGCLVTLAPALLPQLRRQFEHAYPDVDVSQRAAHQAELFDGLRHADIDLAITYDMDIPNDIHFSPVASLPPFVLLDPEHPLAERDSIPVTDLASHPMVLLDLPISRDYFLAHFLREGLRAPVAERTRDMETLRSLVANGYGFGLLNLSSNNTQAADGKPLLQRPLVSQLEPLLFGVAVAKSEYRNRNVEAFVEHLGSQVELLGLDRAGL